MSKLPFMPLYVADYDAATNWCDLETDGLYMRVLRLLWSTPKQSIPNDEKWITRTLRITPAQYETFLVIKEEFLNVKNGRIYQKRLSIEFTKAEIMHNKRVEAGKKGGDANALKTKEKKSSKALAKPKQSSSEALASTTTVTSTYTDTDTKKDKSRASRISQDWKPSKDLVNQISLKEKTNIKWVEEQVYSFVNYWIAKSGKDATKLDWDATFRNWCAKSYNKPEKKKHMETCADWGVEETDEIVTTITKYGKAAE